MQEKREEIYKQIKKRLADYRYRLGFLTLGTLIFAMLFILSLVPVVPAIIAGFLNLMYTHWIAPLYFSCISAFGALFWIFQRFVKKIEEKRGIALEERMYVYAYEASCHLREYLDPDHPIKSGKLKAERKVQRILTLFAGIVYPNAVLMRDETVQLWQLGKNLRMKLLPSMKKHRNLDDSRNIMENVNSSLTALVDYLSKPDLPSLVALNQRMMSLPETKERSASDYVKNTLLKRSNLRHVLVFSAAIAAAFLVAFVDLTYLGASLHEAFILWIGSSIALATLYVTYLGLTVRREQGT